MNALKKIMIRAWEIARSGVTAFGGKIREYFAQYLKQAWKENNVKREETEVGSDGHIDENLNLRLGIYGGGTEPSVSVYVAYDKYSKLKPTSERVSGSRRSGDLFWKLAEDRFYYVRCKRSNRETAERWIATFDGVTAYFKNREDAEKEMEIRFADTKKAVLEQRAAREAAQRAEEEVRAAEQARRDREYAERMENRRLELEAEAERIEEEGQGNEDGLPDLTGSPKQIAWALKIRSAVAGSDAKLKALKTATTAKYWIDNHKHALPR